MSTSMPIAGHQQQQQPSEAFNTEFFVNQKNNNGFPSTKTTPQILKYKAIMRSLAIAEVMLGAICVVLGVIVSAIVGHTRSYYRSLYNRRTYNYYSNYDYYDNYRYQTIFATGEGIWCGVWIIIAGSVGISAAKNKASRCSINSHLAWSIIACLFSAALAIIGAIAAYEAPRNLINVVAINSVLSLTGFASLILHILSASYCCAANGCCCSDNYAAPPVGYYGGQIMLTQPSTIGMNGVIYTQQPTMLQTQGALSFQQGFVLHGAQPMVQTTFPGTVLNSPPVQQNQMMNQTAATPRNDTSSDNVTNTAAEDLPPSYNAAVF